MSITIRKVEQINKLWGYEDVVVNSIEYGYCGKVMKLYRGYQSSLHLHSRKTETMYIIEGSMYVESPKNHLRKVSVGDVIDIPVGTPHRFISVNEPCTFIEFSQPHSDEDVTRFEISKRVDE